MPVLAPRKWKHDKTKGASPLMQLGNLWQRVRLVRRQGTLKWWGRVASTFSSFKTVRKEAGLAWVCVLSRNTPGKLPNHPLVNQVSGDKMSMMVLTTCVHIQRALKKGTNFMPAYSLIRVNAIFVLPVKKEMKRRRNKSYSEKKIKQHKETSFTTSQFSRPHREPRFLSDGNHAIRNRLIFFFPG